MRNLILYLLINKVEKRLYIKNKNQNRKITYKTHIIE